jgi:hypothetical protein
MIEGRLEFSHLADGYDVERKEPTPVSPEQKRAWSGHWWVGIPARMEGNHVIEGDLENEPPSNN